MRTITILRILVLVLALSSCRTVNKSLNKKKETERTETTVNTVATQTTAVSSTVVATRTIVEELDTNQVIKGSVITATGTAKTLDTGGVIRHETEDQVIEVKKDPATGAITATGTVKDRKIPVKGKKTTIETVAATTSSTAGAKISQYVHQDTDKKASSTERQVTREPGANFIAIGFYICLFLVLVILLIRWYVKRQVKKLPL